jgi:hypothetical protein
MRKNQRVADMADEVLARQAMDRAKRTGEPFEQALGPVLGNEAGHQLEELRRRAARRREGAGVAGGPRGGESPRAPREAAE